MKKIATLASLLFFIVLFCQEQRGIVHTSVEEGLSQGTVFDMLQDDSGFIWIATADGLNRFDGYNFRIFKNDPGNPAAVSQPSFRNLFKGKSTLWMSAGMELYRMDFATLKMRKAFTLPVSGNYGELLPFREKGDTLWLLVGQGIMTIDTKTGRQLQQFPLPVPAFAVANVAFVDTARLWYISFDQKQLCSFTLRTHAFQHRGLVDPSGDTLRLASICGARNGQLWIGSYDQVIAYDPVAESFTQIPISNHPATAAAEQVLTVAETSDGFVWFGTSIGTLYRLDKKTGQVVPQNDPAKSTSGFLHRTIKFLEDRTGNLWIGTDPDGVYRIDTKKKPFHHTYNDPAKDEDLKSNFIKSFLQVGDEIYIGTYDQGINVYHPQTGRYRFINGFQNSGTHYPSITSMEQDATGRIWVSTGEGIAVLEKGATALTRPTLTTPSPLAFTSGSRVHVLPDQSVLVCSDEGLFKLVRSGNAWNVITYPGKTIMENYLVDRNGNWWICGPAGIYFLKKDAPPESFSLLFGNTGRIKCLYQDAAGIIWAGSVNGLFKIDPAQKKILRVYTGKDGMPNTFIYGMLADEKQQLWISTNKGIARFDPNTENFRNYSVSDGLQSNEFNTGAYYKSPDGELFFGGVNGFNHFYPAQIKDNPFAPQASITGLKIFDKPFLSDSVIECKKLITLDYTRNNLLLEYTALEFSDPSKNSFKYRLLGLDTNWVNAGKERFARFVNLDPGEYVFQLKAANNDGRWNSTPLELRITITPPFWKTVPFIASMMALGLVLLLIGIRFYLRRQVRLRTRDLQLEQRARIGAIIETEEKERKRIAGELHDGLGQLLSTARLNVAGLGEDEESQDNVLLKNSLQLLDEACAEVRTISHNMMPGALIRLGLAEAVNELINKINDTEKIKIAYDTNLDERLPETTEVALYRIVQEVLTNMLRHAEAKNISVRIDKTGEQLLVVIADDGKGLDVAQIQHSGGLGWKNIYSRLGLLEGTMDIASEKGKGTTITINIPLRP